MISRVMRMGSAAVALVEEASCAIFVVAICLLIFLEVIARELGLPLAWMEETAIYIFVVFVFISAALATRRREHLIVEVLPHFLGERMSLTILGLVVHVVCFAMLCLFAYLSYLYMLDAWARPGYAPASGFHLGWPKSALFVGALLMAGHFLAITVGDCIKLRRGSPKAGR